MLSRNFLQYLARGKLYHVNSTKLRGLSSSPASSSPEELQSEGNFKYYKTSETDPVNHTHSHAGRFYKVPDDVAHLLGIKNNFLPQPWQERCNLFGENNILVRKPALEIIGYLKQMDLAKVMAPKFVLWGVPGCGKSVTLSHLAHYCHNKNFIILNFHRIQDWFVKNQETAVSEYKEGRIDHLLDSRDFLKQFLLTNGKKIENLKIHKTYKWSLREETVEQSPLLSVVQMGIERPKFAADCLNVVMKELKLHCQEKTEGCKIAIIVDGVNVIFEPKSYVSKEWNSKGLGPFTSTHIENSAKPDELSVIYNLKKMLVSDYPNSIILTSVDRKDKLIYSTPKYFMWWKYLEKSMVPTLDTDLPFDLLSQEGWELFDPFIPIEVPAYSPGELDVVVDFHVDKKYIRDVAASEAGRREIHFITGRNPLDFHNYSNYW